MKSSPWSGATISFGMPAAVSRSASRAAAARAGLAGVGEDRDAPHVGRPLPARHAVGRERGPDRDAEDRLRGERGLDALGDAEVTVVADREQPNRAVRHRAQHLLAGRRLRRAVVEQEGAVDAADRRAVGATRDGDHARPAACAVVVGQIGVVEQVRRAPGPTARGCAGRSRPGCPRAAGSRRGCGGPRACGRASAAGARRDGRSMRASRAASSKSAPSVSPVA